MSHFLAVKTLIGFNYVRADQVIAISANDPHKCTIFLSGGVAIPCAEPSKDVLARLAAPPAAEPAAEAKEEAK